MKRLFPTPEDSGQEAEKESVAEAAARWLVALDDDAVTAETRAEFERWRGADPRHAAAYQRAAAMRQALAGLARRKADEGVTRLRDGVLARGDGGRERKRRASVISWGVGLAAAAAVVMFFSLSSKKDAGGGKAMARAVVAESHAPAEVARVIALPDGSTVELNADSQLDVLFNAGERRVVLRAGEGHFSVVKDAARPFVVAAGDLAVRAVGTAFNVRLAAASIEVLVTEGRVAVGQVLRAGETGKRSKEKRDEAATLPLVPSLEAGQRVTLPTGGAVAAITPRIEAVDTEEIGRALAWQTSVLVFAETPLGEAVEQFNRRNGLQIILGDRELAEQRVGGKIRVDSPETFVRVLETSGAIVVDRGEPGRIVLRKAR
jgi:transmembrane sensor